MKPAEPRWKDELAKVFQKKAGALSRDRKGPRFGNPAYPGRQQDGGPRHRHEICVWSLGKLQSGAEVNSSEVAGDTLPSPALEVESKHRFHDAQPPLQSLVEIRGEGREHLGVFTLDPMRECRE